MTLTDPPAALPLTPGAPRLWSMPSGPGFVDHLAATLASATGLTGDPMALADAQIFVPNQRSARTLANALFEASKREGFMPPSILPLGDIAGEPPSTLLSGLGINAPPALDEHERLGLLAALVMRWGKATGSPFNPASALIAAQNLGELIGQAAMLGEDPWEKLPGLVEDAALAKHWEVSLDFLKIVTESWPGVLADNQVSEPLALRRMAAQALIRRWRTDPPDAPVIIAGSTGATPVSRDLMAAALELPHGLVVLPGVDPGLQANTLRQIADEPSHPQHVLARTLNHLGKLPADVATWPSDPGHAARRDVLKLALAPKSATADWLPQLGALPGPGDPGSRVRAALAGLTRIEADTEAEEARLAALLMRETLETPGRSAAYVTPDATLARRVASELRRWGITVEPSAGTPLLRTLRGSLSGIVMDWLLDPGDPVTLLALLRHPLVSVDSETVDALEYWRLRGPRYWQDLNDLIGPRDDKEIGTEAIDGLIQRLLDAGEAWRQFDERPDLSAAMRVLAEMLDQLTGSDHEESAWSGRDGEALAELLRATARVGKNLPQMTTNALRDVFFALAEGVNIADPEHRHARLQILGPLEARLISMDRVILGGMNENTWPALPGAEAFLPRQFRTKLGLPDPEERIGLAAHDFAGLASAQEVFLLRSKRVDNQPSVPSRWWWRLTAISNGAEVQDAFGGEAAARYLQWARNMDRRVDGLPGGHALKPDPQPPRESRPPGISVTQVETLIRDPYAIYASKVLGLKALKPVGAEMDAASRGTALHEAVERFEELDPENASADALLGLFQKELLRAGQSLDSLRAERMALRKTAEAFVDWRSARMEEAGTHAAPELRGAITFAINDRIMQLTGQADRVEVSENGAVAIMDFKSGNPPSARQVELGLNAQMPLLAEICRQGGFGELRSHAPGEVSELLYVRLAAGLEVKFAGDPAASSPVEKGEAAFQGLQKLLTIYDCEDKSYPSKPVARYLKDWGDFDRLARRQEWADQGAGDGGGDA